MYQIVLVKCLTVCKRYRSPLWFVHHYKITKVFTIFSVIIRVVVLEKQVIYRYEEDNHLIYIYLEITVEDFKMLYQGYYLGLSIRMFYFHPNAQTFKSMLCLIPSSIHSFFFNLWFQHFNLYANKDAFDLILWSETSHIR